MGVARSCIIIWDALVDEDINMASSWSAVGYRQEGTTHNLVETWSADGNGLCQTGPGLVALVHRILQPGHPLPLHECMTDPPPQPQNKVNPCEVAL
jgi:hypothetical protein